MTTRINRTNIQYVNSVNSIDLIFAHDKKVRQAWRDLKNLYSRSDPTYAEADNMNMKLIEEIAICVGYKNKITWQDITIPYVPRWLNEEWKNNAEFKKLQLQFGNVISAFSQKMTHGEKESNKNAKD